MDGQTAPVVAAPLTLAHVDSYTNGNATRRQRRDQLERECTGLRRCVEYREYSVPGVLGTPASVSVQQAVDDGVVDAELVSPMRGPPKFATPVTVIAEPSTAVSESVRN